MGTERLSRISRSTRNTNTDHQPSLLHSRHLQFICTLSHDLTDSNAIQFLTLLDHANLTQHVLFPTHRHSHTLDLVITSANFTLSPTVISLPILPTDHFPIICSLKITASPTAPIAKHLTRAIYVL